MTRKPILCLDFDGVLHSYSSGWKGAAVIPDPPTKGMVSFLIRADFYFDLQIFSSRSHQEGGAQAMRDWLWKAIAEHFDVSFGGNPNDFAYATKLMERIKFPNEKPAAMVSIDDRALCFTGNWEDFEPQELLEFQPWNKKSQSPSYPTIVSRLARLIRRIQTVLMST